MYSILLETPISSTPSEIYTALTQQLVLQQWFAPQVIITPKINTFGAFAFEFDLSFKIQIKELEPGKKVSWQVVEGLNDWINSTISFNIIEKNNFSILFFQHTGLGNPSKREKWEKSWKDLLQKLAHLYQNPTA